jgi:putative transposase
MLLTLRTHLKQAVHHRIERVHSRLLAWTKPATHGQVLGTLADLVRSKPELMAENAILHQQLIILRRSVKQGIVRVTYEEKEAE